MAVKSEFSRWRSLPSWIFLEVKCDVSGSCSGQVSTFVPNLVQISQTAAELWQLMCFQNGGQPPSWILAEVKFESNFVSGMSVLVSELNFALHTCNSDPGRLSPITTMALFPPFSCLPPPSFLPPPANNFLTLCTQFCTIYACFQ